MDQDETSRLATTEQTAIMRLLTTALPPGWVVLGRCRQGSLGPSPQPTGCHVLAHAGIGIALLDVAPNATPNAEARLRRVLGAVDFEDRFPGTLPMWHGRIEPGQLRRLPPLLEQAFATQPETTLPSGGAWVGAVREALDADPAWEATGRAKRPAMAVPDTPFVDEDEEDEPGPRARRAGIGPRGLLLGLAFAGIFVLGLGAGALLVPTLADAPPEERPPQAVATRPVPPSAGPAAAAPGAPPPPPPAPAAVRPITPDGPAAPRPASQSTAATSPAPPAVATAATSPAPPAVATAATSPAPPAAAEPRAEEANAAAAAPEATPQAAAASPAAAIAPVPPGVSPAAAEPAGPDAAEAGRPRTGPWQQTADATAPAPDAQRSANGATAVAAAPPAPSIPLPPVAGGVVAGADTPAPAPAPAPAANGAAAAAGDEAGERGMRTGAAAERTTPGEADAVPDLPLPPAAIAQRPPPRPAQRALPYDRRCADALFRWQQGARLSAAEMAFVRDGCVASAARR